MNYLKKFGLIFLFCLFIIILISLTYHNAFLFYIITILFILLISFKFKTKHFALYLFAFSFLLRLIAVLIINTPVQSDFAVMYNASKQLLQGKHDYLNSQYFLNWGYQMGHVLYQFLLLKICDSVLFLKIINCVLHSGIVVLIYLIAKNFTNDVYARISSLIYTVFLFPLLLNTVLTNQQLSAFAMLLAIHIFLSPKYDNMNSILKNIIIGLLLVISNISRPEISVIIISLLIYFILNLTKTNWKRTLKYALTIFATYFLVFNLVSYILIKSNISKSGLENKNPIWKFALGLNANTNGRYNNEDAGKYSSVKQIEAAKKIVYDRSIGNLSGLPKLFLNKSIIFWTDSSLSWSTGFLRNKFISIGSHKIYYNTIDDMTIKYNRYILFTIIILFMAGLIYNITYYIKINNKILLIYIIILMYFLIYLLIEIMPRYAYTPQIFLSILSSFGVKFIFENIINKRNNEVISKN